MLSAQRHFQNRADRRRGFTLAMRALLLAGFCISCLAQDSTPDRSREVRATVTDRDTEAAIAGQESKS